MLDNPISKKPTLAWLFIWCIMRANHKPTKIIWNGEEMVLEKGQFITGRIAASKETGIPKGTIYDNLRLLSHLMLISLNPNNRFTLISVLNYSKYQGGFEKPTSGQHLANTDKNVKNVKN